MRGTSQGRAGRLGSCQEDRLRRGAPGHLCCLLTVTAGCAPCCCVLQVKAGLGVNVIGLVTVMVAINTWGISLFNLNTFPAWAKVSNITDQA